MYRNVENPDKKSLKEKIANKSKKTENRIWYRFVKQFIIVPHNNSK